MGQRGPLQRPRPLRGRAGRRRAGRRATRTGWGSRPGCWPELIEAAVRSGKPERAAGPLRAARRRSPSANGTDWALGILARAPRAAQRGEAAERLYREAIERLGRTRIRVALARAHLLYGEWLRREHRRVDAREQLRTAHEMLADMGMEAFAERARRELLATGETVRKRTVETLDELTAAGGADRAAGRATGDTNPEIGAQLFLSPRTVEWHLRKVFGKLGISSRRELGAAGATRRPRDRRRGLAPLTPGVQPGTSPGATGADWEHSAETQPQAHGGHHEHHRQHHRHHSDDRHRHRPAEV